MIVYFAYGSNMLRARLESRVGSVHVLGPGRLAHHRHSFTKLGRDGTGKGNISRSAGDSVYGVLYRMSAQQMGALRGFENGYLEVSLAVALGASGVGEVATEVTTEVTTEILAQTFRAERPIAAMRPSREYLEYYEAGMREHGLPEAYQASVRAQARLRGPS